MPWPTKVRSSHTAHDESKTGVAHRVGLPKKGKKKANGPKGPSGEPAPNGSWRITWRITWRNTWRITWRITRRHRPAAKNSAAPLPASSRFRPS